MRRRFPFRTFSMNPSCKQGGDLHQRVLGRVGLVVVPKGVDHSHRGPTAPCRIAVGSPSASSRPCGSGSARISPRGSWTEARPNGAGCRWADQRRVRSASCRRNPGAPRWRGPCSFPVRAIPPGRGPRIGKQPLFRKPRPARRNGRNFRASARLARQPSRHMAARARWRPGSRSKVVGPSPVT